jgi:hypothetical protein
LNRFARKNGVEKCRPDAFYIKANRQDILDTLNENRNSRGFLDVMLDQTPIELRIMLESGDKVFGASVTHRIRAAALRKV